MKIAWSRTVLLDAFKGPDWWPGRYSAEGFLLAPPAAPAPPAPEAAAAPFPGPFSLPRHSGKAASLLGACA